VRLEVSLHGRTVGHITQGAHGSGDDRFVFALVDDYFRDSSRDVLGQTFEERRAHQYFQSSRRHPDRLPTYFANLLPEGALRAMVDAQRTGAQDDGETLALVGEDLPGAAVVRLAAPESSPSGIAPEQLAFEESPKGSAPLDELRFSLAGVQLKFSAIRDPNDRFVLPFRGRGGRWILKFGSTQFPSLPENEFATMSWARKCGITMPRIELLPSSSVEGLAPGLAALGENVFAIERYDRAEDGGRVHQEDLAQVLGVLPDFKYGGISYEKLALLVGELAGAEDMREMLRRLWFSIVCGNTDAHLKNWSFTYPDRLRARLSPAYDLVFVGEYLPHDALALTLAKEKQSKAIGWEHVTRVERYLRSQGQEVDVLSDAKELVACALDVWSTHRAETPKAYREKMDAHLATLPWLIA
jgi:serine/threonine-protein kinase HipA